jgi:hypothetical protein
LTRASCTQFDILIENEIEKEEKKRRKTARAGTAK